AVSASGIAYWLNREAVLSRTQDAALGDFRQETGPGGARCPAEPGCSLGAPPQTPRLKRRRG
ncbi:hypothetical protein ACWCQL_31480, partial [Streptomyces sp. NPDC002073]